MRWLQLQRGVRSLTIAVVPMRAHARAATVSQAAFSQAPEVDLAAEVAH